MRKLIPLQGALGMVDVQAKANDIKQDCAHERNVAAIRSKLLRGQILGFTLSIIIIARGLGYWPSIQNRNALLLTERPRARRTISGSVGERLRGGRQKPG